MPSKLLIQAPRFGRDFKFYEKIIPGTKLKVRDLLCSKRKAAKVCTDSEDDFPFTSRLLLHVWG